MTRVRILGVGLLASSLAACASLPVVIDTVASLAANVTPPAPTAPATPKVEPPPVAAPPVVEPRIPAPEPELPPLRNMNVVVVASDDGSPVPGAWCVVDGDRRVADGGGFINFAARDERSADCGADGFATRRGVPVVPGERTNDVAILRTVPRPPPPAAPNHCAGREFDGLSCVREVAAKYPALLVTNTYESCLEFTRHVLAALGPEWGHVGKSAGEGQFTPPGFVAFTYTAPDGQVFRITGVSHDAIKNRATGQVVDLLGNASANSDPDASIHGVAMPMWSTIPEKDWRVSNPFVEAMPIK